MKQHRRKVNANRAHEAKLQARHDARKQTAFRDALVADLAKDFVDFVKEVESADLQLTQNHYGKYMSVLTAIGDNDKERGRLIADALIRAAPASSRERGVTGH